MIDQIALEAARKIEDLPKHWHEVRRRAATQVIVVDAIKRALPNVRGMSAEEALIESITGELPYKGSGLDGY